jgi:predicted nucleic acid-binding Zn ribbon protein
MSEAPLRKCPECRKLKLTRLISAGGGLIFKGSGFYITDYRDQSYHDAAKADTPGKDGKSDKTQQADPKAPAPKASGGPDQSAPTPPAAKDDSGGGPRAKRPPASGVSRRGTRKK